MTTTPHAELLDLPGPKLTVTGDRDEEYNGHWYTADQMRAYATQALASLTAERDALQAQVEVLWAENDLARKLHWLAAHDLASGWIAGRAETYAEVYPNATPAEAYQAGAEFALRSKVLLAARSAAQGAAQVEGDKPCQ